MSTPRSLLPPVTLLLLGLAIGRAAWATDPVQADSLGQGGAMRADPDALGAVFRSPGVIGLEPHYDVVAAGRIGPNKERLVQVAAADSRTGPVSAGLVFLRRQWTPRVDLSVVPGWSEPDADLTNPTQGMVAGGAVAGAWADRRFGAGVGVFYEGETSRFGEAIHSVDVSASVAGEVGEVLVLSLGGQDLIPGGPSWSKPVAGVGARLLPAPPFSIEADLDLGLDRVLDGEVDLAPKAGFEAIIAETVPLRGGWMLEGDAHFVTAGIGIQNIQFRLDYGGRMRIGDQPSTGDLTSWHGLSLRVSL